MAIASSGAVSFADLRTEYVGGSSAISLNDLYRGGSNIKAKAGDNNATNLAASVPASGVIDVQDFHGTSKGFKFTYSSTTTNQDMDTVFGDDYDLNYPKIVDINAGVILGGSGDEAIDIPSGLAGTLTINNSGSIIGAAGTAGSANSGAGGAGGHAISCASSGVTLNNLSGSLLAGGGGGSGGGGQGGTGGNSSYSQTLTYTNSMSYFMMQSSYWTLYWANSTLASSFTPPYTSGGYTYSQLNAFSWDDNYTLYGVSRTGNITTYGGSGGAGAAGAVGQGYNQNAGSATANGSSGAAGGTNAGTGGTGGGSAAGSAYGVAGVQGTQGATGGNSGAAGNAGGAGGSAGAATSGTSITINNSGTVSGATA